MITYEKASVERILCNSKKFNNLYVKMIYIYSPVVHYIYICIYIYIYLPLTTIELFFRLCMKYLFFKYVQKRFRIVYLYFRCVFNEFKCRDRPTQVTIQTIHMLLENSSGPNEIKVLELYLQKEGGR